MLFGHGNGGSLHPIVQTLVGLGILPVTSDDIPGHSLPDADEAMRPVTVDSLVQVHEVHVDLVVGDLLVVLDSQMAPELLQVHKAVDSHFGGGRRCNTM